jgi:hypothetical protein
MARQPEVAGWHALSKTAWISPQNTISNRLNAAFCGEIHIRAWRASREFPLCLLVIAPPTTGGPGHPPHGVSLPTQKRHRKGVSTEKGAQKREHRKGSTEKAQKRHRKGTEKVSSTEKVSGTNGTAACGARTCADGAVA